jgi:hypothetical protein
MDGWMDEGMVGGQETLFPLSSRSCGELTMVISLVAVFATYLLTTH